MATGVSPIPSSNALRAGDRAEGAVDGLSLRRIIHVIETRVRRDRGVFMINWWGTLYLNKTSSAAARATRRVTSSVARWAGSCRSRPTIYAPLRR